MTKRMAAITFIFLCTSFAWSILGATIQYRTANPADSLRSAVENTWGSPHVQKPPTATYVEMVQRTERKVEEGKTTDRIFLEPVEHVLEAETSRIQVNLELEHRQKGLLWFSTYSVRFAGRYVFRNATSEAKPLSFAFLYPATQGTYDELTFTVNGQPGSTEGAEGRITSSAVVNPGETAEVLVSYRSQGLDRWSYDFSRKPSHVRDFELRMTTNFRGIDFPENTLSPTARQETDGGWSLEWKYSSLLTSYAIAMQMPERLQPGPLAGKISYFAPVSLFFFFFLMFIITTIRGIDLHPMNYFFLATSFFSFHLLLAYLVDHLSIHWSFLICSVVSVFLVVSYLRLVVNLRFAAFEAAGAQFVYLILFSYAFFWEGFTGLSITIGSIVTLFLVMQLTGRVNWQERFRQIAQTPSR